MMSDRKGMISSHDVRKISWCKKLNSFFRKLSFFYVLVLEGHPSVISLGLHLRY